MGRGKVRYGNTKMRGKERKGRWEERERVRGKENKRNREKNKEMRGELMRIKQIIYANNSHK